MDRRPHENRHRRFSAGHGRRRRDCHVGAVQPRRHPSHRPLGASRRRQLPEGNQGGRPAPRRRRAQTRTGRARAHVGAARLGLHLAGRGAQPSRAHGPSRRAARGPGLLPHEGRGDRTRRMQGAPAVGGRRARLRFLPRREVLAAPAARVEGVRGGPRIGRPALAPQPLSPDVRAAARAEARLRRARRRHGGRRRGQPRLGLSQHACLIPQCARSGGRQAGRPRGAEQRPARARPRRARRR